MLNKYFTSLIAVTFFLFFTKNTEAQIALIQDSSFITMKASEKYYKSKNYRFFWGDHYRQEWHTPVTFRKTKLDTLAGGLTTYGLGGGRQSKSIRVRDVNEREYVFRSVDKSFGKALPGIAQGTFLEDIADDQVTISHPYANVVVAPLAAAANIYHTNPAIYFVPKQDALGKYNDSAGNILYSFEQRPDENWETAPNFGNSKNIVSTDKMLEKLLADHDNTIDQKMFARCRLFDMLIGDWGRHEDQWRWASFENDKKTLYAPIPRDRDNAFTKFDGFLLKRLISAANAKHLQTFDYEIKDVARLNFPARNLDHHLLNELTEEDWVRIAEDIKQRLTDNVIDNAVNQMPAEVYPISGPEIAAKLKSRRDLLPQYAVDYYKFLSEEVEVTGTEKDERFEVNRLSDAETEVVIYKISKKGIVKDTPIYHRIFKNNETKEIRLYGIGGNDEYHISGKTGSGIKVRLIGGPGKDKYVDESSVSGHSHRTKIYDNYGNDIRSSRETSVKLSSDSAINNYNYAYFNYNKKSISPKIFYNQEDRIYVGLGYHSIKYKWRKYPLANTQYIDAKYSISQKAFSSTYSSTYTDILSKWSLNNYLNYDAVRWKNFYGLGNETILHSKERDFYRMRSQQFNAAVGLDRVFNHRHKLIINASYQDYTIINDSARFLSKQFNNNGLGVFHNKDFGGMQLQYIYQHLNDSVLPVKGIIISITGNYVDNLKSSKGDIGIIASEVTLLAPLTKHLGLVIHGGGSSLSGSPQFFQYNSIGGNETLRGYQRDRFYGNSTAYIQNELRWISNIRTHIFNGKIGLFALYDAGRVWLRGEESNTWHPGYGGGIIISPFNKIAVSAAYAVSPEDRNIHIRILKPL